MLRAAQVCVRAGSKRLRLQSTAAAANTPRSDLPWHSREAIAATRKRGNNKRKEFLRSEIQGVLGKPLVAVVQYGNLSAVDWLKLRYDLKQAGASVSVFPNKVAGRVAEHSTVPGIGPMLASTTAFVHCEEVQFGLLQILEDAPNVVIVGGKLENSLLSADQLIQCKQLGDLDTMRSRLVQTLAEPARRLASVLGSSQQELVSLLGRIEK